MILPVPHPSVFCTFDASKVEHSYVLPIVVSAPVLLTVHVLTYNESVLLPLFVKFYTSRVPSVRIVVHDNESTDGTSDVARALGCAVIPLLTNNVFDEFMLTKVRNTCWYGDASTWVLVCDCDEFVDVREDFLQTCRTPVIQCTGVQMLPDAEQRFPSPVRINAGYADAAFNKPVLFRRAAVKLTELSPGSHYGTFTAHDGSVLDQVQPGIVLRHHHCMSAAFAVARRAARKSRRNPLMDALGMDINGAMSEEQVRAAVFADMAREKTALSPDFWSSVLHADCIPEHKPVLDALSRFGDAFTKDGDVLQLGDDDGHVVRALSNAFPDSLIVCVNEATRQFLLNTAHLRTQLRQCETLPDLLPGCVSFADVSAIDCISKDSLLKVWAAVQSSGCVLCKTADADALDSVAHSTRCDAMHSLVFKSV